MMHPGRIVCVLLSLLLLAAACGDDPKANVDGPNGEAPSDAGGGAQGGSSAAQNPLRANGKVAQLEKTERLRESLVELSHFVERSRDESFLVNLGHVDSHKYIVGGWRSGWRAEPRKSGEADYYEADDKSARVFFKHKEGGFDRIVVRMKAVKNENKVVFYVNDNAISNTPVTNQWGEYEVKVPKEFTRDGENQFMMRFNHEADEGGRRQVIHADWVKVLAPGADKDALPAGPAVGEVDLGGDKRKALLASVPTTWTYRAQLPAGEPKLALAMGAKEAGVKFKVEVASDLTPNKAVLESEAKAGAWGEEVVDLKEFANHVVELKITASGAFGPQQQVALGDAGLWAPAPKDDAKPATPDAGPAKNVLIYLIDTLRYDKLGVYNPKSSVPTPNFDAFAKDATLYEAAYDMENWTKPSTATILTGLYPETHGAKEESSKLPASAKMISEQLKANGFKTGAFLSNGYVSDAFGFKKGWDHYTNYIREEKNSDADQLVTDSLAWIDQNKGERFFAYLHTIDPHVPYNAPKDWKEKFYKGKYEGAIKPSATGDQLADIKTGKMSITADDKRYLEALYDGEVGFNDQEFGRLVQGLKERGLYDSTLIVVLVDHGEEFWEHDSVGHGHSVYDELVHAPFFVRYPGRTALGRRVPQVVSMVDVAPTVMEVAGVPPMEGVEGVSLTDTFDGVGTPRPRLAVSDFLFRKKGIRAGRYHWLTTGRGGELYDLATDRHEKKDIIKTHFIGRAFARTLTGVFMGAKDKTKWWEPGSAVAAAPTKKHKAEAAEVDKDLEAQLRALGYVDGHNKTAKDEKHKDEEPSKDSAKEKGDKKPEPKKDDKKSDKKGDKKAEPKKGDKKSEPKKGDKKR